MKISYIFTNSNRTTAHTLKYWWSASNSDIGEMHARKVIWIYSKIWRRIYLYTFIFVSFLSFEFIWIFIWHLLTLRIYSDICSPCLLHFEYIQIFIHTNVSVKCLCRIMFWINRHLYKNTIKKCPFIMQY